jgi:hypothetical protein
VAYEDVARGVGTGASIGSAMGSIVPGIGTAIGSLAGGLLGGAGGGFLGRQNQETPMQAKQREVIDQLMASLQGNGPYSDLFNADEGTFQRSFVEPMKQKFQSQIAPQIQQSYISSGQQRGTGLDDTLTRAGVDIDQLLNQHYAQMQQQAQANKMNAFGSVLGMGAGPAQTPTIGQSIGQGVSGYLSGGSFGKDIGDITQAFSSKRKGFENS